MQFSGLGKKQQVKAAEHGPEEDKSCYDDAAEGGRLLWFLPPKVLRKLG